MKRSYTILYVDDDLDDLALVADAFEKYTDYLKVTHARNGKEALESLKMMSRQGSLPCLIILDINMPVMNGKEALRNIRLHEDFKAIPVVLFSTSSLESDKRFAKELRADFITKPLSFTDLKTLVKQFVEKCDWEVRRRA